MAVFPHRGHDALRVYAEAADSSSTEKKTNSAPRMLPPLGRHAPKSIHRALGGKSLEADCLSAKFWGKM